MQMQTILTPELAQAVFAQPLMPQPKQPVELACQIYDLYPRKVARKAAIAAILKALRKVPGMTLMERTKAYAEAKAGADHQFIPHASTWFNQERWDDDPAEWRVGQSPKVNGWDRIRDEKRLDRLRARNKEIKSQYWDLQTWAADDVAEFNRNVAEIKELKAKQ